MDDMETKKLPDILNALSESISKLLELSKAKQKVLIQRDHDQLNTISENEQKYLNDIANLSKQQRLCTDQLKLDFGVPSGMSSLTDIIELIGNRLNPEFSGRVLTTLNNIKENSIRLERTNEQNKMLIETSRTFIKAIIQAVRGNGNNSLINRRM